MKTKLIVSSIAVACISVLAACKKSPSTDTGSGGGGGGGSQPGVDSIYNPVDPSTPATVGFLEMTGKQKHLWRLMW